MRTQRWWAVIAVAVALLGVMAVGAPAGGFERKPIDRNLLTSPEVARGGMRFVQFMTDPLFEALPEGVEHKVQYGRIALDAGEPMAFVVCASQADGPLDTLYIDVKRSGDLAGAAVFKDLPANMLHNLTVTLADGQSVDLEIALTESYLLVRMEPDWWLGTVEIDGQTRMAAMIDMNGDGLKLDEGSNMLLIDLDGSGVFESDPENGFLGEAMLLQSELVFGGKLYEVALDAEKIDLQLTPYQGPVGWLALETSLQKTPQSFLMTTYYMPGGDETWSYRYINADSDSFPLPFKPAEINRMIGVARFHFETGGPVIMQYQVEEPMVFQADTTTTLALGAHDPLTVTVTQVNGQLRVAQSLTGPGGITYMRIEPMPDPEAITEGDSDAAMVATLLANQGPSVTILDADGQVLAEGAMEYG